MIRITIQIEAINDIWNQQHLDTWLNDLQQIEINNQEQWDAIEKQIIKL